MCTPSRPSPFPSLCALLCPRSLCIFSLLFSGLHWCDTEPYSGLSLISESVLFPPMTEETGGVCGEYLGVCLDSHLSQQDHFFLQSLEALRVDSSLQSPSPGLAQNCRIPAPVHAPFLSSLPSVTGRYRDVTSAVLVATRRPCLRTTLKGPACV